MKNKLLSFVVLMISLVASGANAISPFNGYNAGASIGWTHNKVKSEIKNTDLSKTVTKNLMPVGVFINYMYSAPNSFLWALEASFDYEFGKDVAFKNNAGVERIKAKKSYSAMLTPKFGYNFQDNLAVYALMGLGGTSWKYSFPNSGVSSDKKFQLLIAPGAGLEIDLGNNIKAGGEFKWVSYKTHSKNLSGVKAEFTPKVYDFRFRLSYNFNNNL